MGRRLRSRLSSLQAARCSLAHACRITGPRSHMSPLQAARDMLLAAADEVTRQRCMRIIDAASVAPSSPLQDIAAATALTRDLLNLQKLSAVNAVLAALGRAAVKGLDVLSLIEGFGYDAMAALGCDASSMILVSCSVALPQLHIRNLELNLKPPLLFRELQPSTPPPPPPLSTQTTATVTTTSPSLSLITSPTFSATAPIFT
jgi:hypothetical protein